MIEIFSGNNLKDLKREINDFLHVKGAKLISISISSETSVYYNIAIAYELVYHKERV
jgi:hypothetical protein